MTMSSLGRLEASLNAVLCRALYPAHLVCTLRVSAIRKGKRCMIQETGLRNVSTIKQRVPSKPSYLNVFDRHAKLLQRKRAAILNQENKSEDGSGLYDYIKDEVMNNFIDRYSNLQFLVSWFSCCTFGSLNERMTCLLF